MQKIRDNKRLEKQSKDPVCLGLRQNVMRRKKYSNFGTTQYNLSCEAQDNKSAMCHVQAFNLEIDHNHNDQSIRGLLRSPCNIGFEQLNENVTYIQNAIEYLISGKKKVIIITQKEENFTNLFY